MAKQSDQVKEFLASIESICKKHSLILCHEDLHGAFVVEKLSEESDWYFEWLRAAFDDTNKEKE